MNNQDGCENEGAQKMKLNLYDQEKFVKEGGKTQEIVWVEELGELQHEITKSLRGNLRKEHLIEELADVLICIEQLRIKYNISEEQLQKWIDVKHNRNCNRLEQKKEDNITLNIVDIEKFASYIKSTITIKNPMYDDLKDFFK